MSKTDEVRFALPSKGSLEAGTMSFLADCGLRVDKVNPRQYTARMPAVPGVVVLFQRAVDILEKVSERVEVAKAIGVIKRRYGKPLVDRVRERA